MSEPNPWSREGGQPSEPQQPAQPAPEPQFPPYQPPPYPDAGHQQPYEQPYQPPYPDAGYQQQPGSYGQPSPYGFVPQAHRQGTAVFTLGILSIVFAFLCGAGLVLGIVALALSGSATREINANPAAYSNGQKVRTGRICAIIGVVLSALALLGRMSNVGQSFN